MNDEDMRELDRIVTEVHRYHRQVREQCENFSRTVIDYAAKDMDFTEVLGFPKTDWKRFDDFPFPCKGAVPRGQWNPEERLMGDCFRLAAVHDWRFVETDSPHELILQEKDNSHVHLSQLVIFWLEHSERGVADLGLTWEWVRPRLEGQVSTGGDSKPPTDTENSVAGRKNSPWQVAWNEQDPDYMQSGEARVKFTDNKLTATQLSKKVGTIPVHYMRTPGKGCRVHIAEFHTWAKGEYPTDAERDEIATEFMADIEARKAEAQRRKRHSQ